MAQLKLQWVVAPADSARVGELGFKTSFRSARELTGYLQQVPALLQAKGYLSASVDSITETDSGFRASLFLGAQYRWRQLRVNNEDRELLGQLGYALPVSGLADGGLIEALPRAVIRFYEDNGYPFARVGWDSNRIEGDQISASLRIDPGALYKLDSIGLQGDLKISENFLHRHLGLEPGTVYRRTVLEAIDRKLAELPYLEQSQPWQLSMHPTGYVLNFFLRPRRTNRVDALVGLLPASQQNSGKLLLTVDAAVLLQNAFAAAETIDFSWEQIQPRSPRLHLHYTQPYIFGSAFGLDAGFHLFKKDASFLNIEGRLGLQYNAGRNQSVTVLLHTRRSNLLDIDTSQVKLNKRLPDIIDLSVLGFGLEYHYRNTDYRFNPRKGTELEVTSSAGRKQLRRNNAISQIRDPSFDYNSLYDSLPETSYQLRLQLKAAGYFPLGRQAVLKTALQSGLLQTPDNFRNEMFQLGGYRVLRGFDEESIFASRFAVFTAEWRYLIGLNSFLFGFTDLGFTRFTSREITASHRFIGFGAGMAFQSRQGIFNISIAAGKRNDLRFNLRQSKIHLGYTSFF